MKRKNSMEREQLPMKMEQFFKVNLEKVRKMDLERLLLKPKIDLKAIS